jgi:CRP-like cAMP-binding protein
MDDKIRLLKQVSIFEGLPEKEIENLAQKIGFVQFAIGKTICEIDEPGDQMYIIKSGEVKVVVYSPSGREIVLEDLSRGDYFGEMALLTEEPRSATVIAILDTALYTLHKKDFNELIKKYPLVAVNLSRIISKRLKKTDVVRRRQSLAQRTDRHFDPGQS